MLLTCILHVCYLSNWQKNPLPTFGKQVGLLGLKSHLKKEILMILSCGIIQAIYKKL